MMTRALAFSALLFSGSVFVTQAADADHQNGRFHGQGHQGGYQGEYSPGGAYVDPRDPNFRRAHPFRVFVAIDAGLNRGQTRGVDNRAEAKIVRSLARNLPNGAFLVDNRRDADMVVRIRERAFDLNFRVVDVDRERRRYKRRRAYAGGQCGPLGHAFYDEIKERGVARYAYDITFRVKGQGRSRDTLRGRASESFRYADNLRASTNCGIQPTVVAPNRKVERLLSRNNPQTRRQVAREIRREAKRDVGRRLAWSVNQTANRYWTAIAANYAGFERRDNTREPVLYGDNRRFGDRDRGPRDLNW